VKSSQDDRGELVNKIILLVLVICTSGLVIERIAFDGRPMNAWAYFSVTVWGLLGLNAAHRLTIGRSRDRGART
jgi:hypothetical protein